MLLFEENALDFHVTLRFGYMNVYYILHGRLCLNRKSHLHSRLRLHRKLRLHSKLRLHGKLRLPRKLRLHGKLRLPRKLRLHGKLQLHSNLDLHINSRRYCSNLNIEIIYECFGIYK
uniref:Uncharacterized protein n=1 Tax=Glossina brevipalpis TaxID=37001 RepID=A0A1A9X5P9_9MUSC